MPVAIVGRKFGKLLATKETKRTGNQTKRKFVCDCGSPPSTTRKARRLNGDFIYNGIDRKQNEKGYEDGNVVSCCQLCNRAKSDLSFEEFEKWLKRIAVQWQ